MITKENVEELLEKDNIVFIDVRSPKEYKEDTIPNAINLPILNDEEREEIGYIYKQVSHNKAKEKGLRYASYKLADIYLKVRELIDEGKEVALFCYRGGMRSQSVATILNVMGLNVFLIDGGYKSYRKYVVNTLEKFKDEHEYVVLHGYTGVGKTKILEELSKKGYKVINLELLAKNRGSVFGSIGYDEESSSQKAFESLLANQLIDISKANGKNVFIESESKRIGKVILPDFLYNKMAKGIRVLIETDIDNRIKNITDDYINIPSVDKNEKIKKCIYLLKKRIGLKKAEELVSELENENYEYVIRELMINYYDPLYKYSIDKFERYDKIISYKSINEAVDKLTDFINIRDR
ncbi:tRNA 2-selenouridine synthase SelU [Gottschalkia purinilytica]|uniref:tRNA 2-selenouridine synthase SelU n=1 Tax=Gottschalkia purinilytica TaxID=1503 RepID=A0A0L0WBH4_GOTPU|nr:tRNA 2-selenouridine(34) synthase MnmH [Gottschalkia purinilytica]KNF08879.1 tRNA 2-selenouridine synthase SelU [Gottschalkia purinilytica]